LNWFFDESKAFPTLPLEPDEVVRGAYTAELGTGLAKTTVKMIITSKHLYLNPMDQSGLKGVASLLAKIPGLTGFEVVPILLGFGQQELLRLPLYDIVTIEPFNHKGWSLPGIRITLRDGSSLDVSIVYKMFTLRGSNKNVVARDEAFRVLQNAISVAASASVQTSSSSILDQMRTLGELRDAGLITSAEFETKKSELLARI
jgi:hypothetical protein